MEENNHRITALQFAIIGAFLSNTLFVGLGITNMLSIAKQDAWISATLGIILGIIPLCILLYIMNYRPDINILEKNTFIYGKLISKIINFLLSAVILLIVIIVLWSTTNFSITMYLVKTPSSFIAGMFVITAIYAVIKGVETIGRIAEILFFIALILVITIVLSLYPIADFDQLKPFLENGLMPVIKNTFVFVSYFFTPVMLLTVIPKNSISNNKHYQKYIIGGFLAGAMLMISVFTIVPSVITPQLAALYSFPAYYVQRKISIGGAIDNVENFLSLHWFFNNMIMIIMGIYFLSKYAEHTFKIKTKKTMNIIIAIIGIMIVILQNYIFKDAVVALDFMKYNFHLYVSLSFFILLFITCFLIFIKRRNKKKA